MEALQVPQLPQNIKLRPALTLNKNKTIHKHNHYPEACNLHEKSTLHIQQPIPCFLQISLTGFLIQQRI